MNGRPWKEPAREGAQLVNELGSFIREQRSSARLSLRRLSELAGISNPYLSQIERGLRRPSAEILQQIAKALRISAETLYVRAGILERPDGDTDLSRHIFADHHLTEEQTPGPAADLPLLPPRERGPGRIGAGRCPGRGRTGGRGGPRRGRAGARPGGPGPRVGSRLSEPGQ